MARPSSLPEWASNPSPGDVTDPGPQRKLTGWKLAGGVPEKPSYQSFNWYMQTAFRWIEYFSEMTDEEFTQIKNIDNVTISNAKWAYLASLENVIMHVNNTVSIPGVTEGRVVVSGAGGLLSSSVTTTDELARVSGVTSGIQGQLNLKAPLASPTFTGTVTAPLITSGSVDNVTLNLGTLTASTINIGRPGATTNFYGDLLNVVVTNSQVADKLVRLNVGGGEFSADGTGIEIEEQGVVAGWMKSASDGQVFSFKAPARGGQIWLSPSAAGTSEIISTATGANKQFTLPNVSGTIALTSDIASVGDIKQGGNSFNAAMTLGTNDNFALNLETNGTVKGTISPAGQFTVGPLVTGNVTGQAHRISGGLWAANVTSSDLSGRFIIGTNAHTGGGTAENNRTDATTGGAAILMLNRTSATLPAISLRVNLPGDTTATSAVDVGTVNYNGAWTFGPAQATFNAGGPAHLINGGLAAGGDKATEYGGELFIGTNARVSGSPGMNFRTGTTTTGTGIYFMNRAASNTPTMSFRANKVSDATTAAAAEVGSLTAEGAWSFGPAPAASTGVTHTFNLTTGGAESYTTMVSGSIRMLNRAATAAPTIAGRSDSAAEAGLTLTALTTNTANSDMVFTVRENDDTDYADMSKFAYDFRRLSTRLGAADRAGSWTFGPPPAAGTGVSHAFNLPTSGGYDIADMPANQIRFCNTSGANPQPTIVGKTSSTATSALYLMGMSQPSATAPAMTIDVRNATSTGPATAMDNIVFRIQNYGASMMHLIQSGCATFSNSGGGNATSITINKVGLSSTYTGTTQLQFQQGGVNCGGINSNGQTGNPTFFNNSDARLKENIRDTERDCLGEICSVRLRDYTWKSSGQEGFSPIAQELREVYPEHVFEGSEGMLNVATGFDWELMRSIQQLKSQLDETRAELAELKSRVAS